MTGDPPEDVRDALASHADDYEIRRELHAVPPHAVYEVRIDGTRAVCKVARGPRADPATEARVMEFVGRETSVPVPRMVAVGEDWFVAEWRDGLGDGPTLDAGRARAMGAGLATLHEETTGAFEATGVPRAEGGDSSDGTLGVDARESWAETVCDLLADRRDYLAEFGYAEVAETAREFVRENPGLFDGAGTPVLAHGNYLPDHVGIRDGEHVGAGGGEVTCVVDWEHALVAPAEYDYWRTAMPLFAGPGDTDSERAAFREGYESVRALPSGFEDRADYYRLVNTVSYLKALHLQDRKDDHEKARLAVAYREYVRDTVQKLSREMSEA